MYSDTFRAEVKKRVVDREAKRLITLLDWLQPETRFAILDAVYFHYERNPL